MVNNPEGINIQSDIVLRKGMESEVLIEDIDNALLDKESQLRALGFDRETDFTDAEKKQFKVASKEEVKLEFGFFRKGREGHFIRKSSLPFLGRYLPEDYDGEAAGNLRNEGGEHSRNLDKGAKEILTREGKKVFKTIENNDKIKTQKIRNIIDKKIEEIEKTDGAELKRRVKAVADFKRTKEKNTEEIKRLFTEKEAPDAIKRLEEEEGDLIREVDEKRGDIDLKLGEFEGPILEEIKGAEKILAELEEDRKKTAEQLSNYRVSARESRATVRRLVDLPENSPRLDLKERAEEDLKESEALEKELRELFEKIRERERDTRNILTSAHRTLRSINKIKNIGVEKEEKTVEAASSANSAESGNKKVEGWDGETEGRKGGMADRKSDNGGSEEIEKEDFEVLGESVEAYKKRVEASSPDSRVKEARNFIVEFACLKGFLLNNDEILRLFPVSNLTELHKFVKKGGRSYKKKVQEMNKVMEESDAYKSVVKRIEEEKKKIKSEETPDEFIRHKDKMDVYLKEINNLVDGDGNKSPLPDAVAFWFNSLDLAERVNYFSKHNKALKEDLKSSESIQALSDIKKEIIDNYEGILKERASTFDNVFSELALRDDYEDIDDFVDEAGGKEKIVSEIIKEKINNNKIRSFVIEKYKQYQREKNANQPNNPDQEVEKEKKIDEALSILKSDEHLKFQTGAFIAAVKNMSDDELKGFISREIDEAGVGTRAAKGFAYRAAGKIYETRGLSVEKGNKKSSVEAWYRALELENYSGKGSKGNNQRVREVFELVHGGFNSPVERGFKGYSGQFDEKWARDIYEIYLREFSDVSAPGLEKNIDNKIKDAMGKLAKCESDIAAEKAASRRAKKRASK